MPQRSTPLLRLVLLKVTMARTKEHAGQVPIEALTLFKKENRSIGKGTPPTQREPQVLNPGRIMSSSTSERFTNVKLPASISAADALEQLGKRFNTSIEPKTLICCAAVVQCVEEKELLRGCSGPITALGCALFTCIGVRDVMFEKRRMKALGVVWNAVREAYNQLWLYRDALKTVLKQCGGDVEWLHVPERVDGNIDMQTITKDLREDDRICSSTRRRCSSSLRGASRLREVMFPEPDVVEGVKQVAGALEEDDRVDSVCAK